MGRYVNPSSANFRRALQGLIYVDKTKMLAYLNRELNSMRPYLCVSRPRGFGKTMAANMICAYYSRDTDARPIFEGLEIASAEPYALPLGDVVAWDTYLGAFDVIHVTVTDFLWASDSIPEMIADITGEVTEELMEAYPDIRYGEKRTLERVMSRVHAKTGARFVAVIDEWDAPFRERPGDTDGQRRYAEFLRALLKDKGWVALAYVTGILPVRYGGQVPLDMFREYSMLAPRQLAPYAGFTAEEVVELCRRHRCDFNPLKEWYDGYEVRRVARVEDQGDSKGEELGGGKGDELRCSLYSPLSVAKAIRNRKVDSYWNASGTFVDLAEQIDRDLDGLKGKVALLMGGGRVEVRTGTYLNDITSFRSADDVLTMLVHLGYLGFDDRTSEVFVPNREVLQEFENAVATDEWAGTFRELEES